MTQPGGIQTGTEQSTVNRIDPSKKIFKCWYCDFKTNWRPSLSKHKRTHTRVKAFKCFACDYRSARRDTLMLHFRAHTGVKPYVCNMCDFNCSLKTTLNIHRKTHKKKSYKCSMCEKVFVKSCFLKFHEKGHMREAPITCNRPECTCKEKGNAREKPYDCDMCTYKYACLSNLTLHKSIHSGFLNTNNSHDNAEENTSEIIENKRSLSSFYAEFDPNESALAVPSSLYQQLINEEFLSSEASGTHFIDTKTNFIMPDVVSASIPQRSFNRTSTSGARFRKK